MKTIYEGEQETWRIGASILIDDEYILLSSAPGGDLYKLYLADNHMEFLISMDEIDLLGKMFSCAFKRGRKIYFVSLYDCYEIIEYDLDSNRLQVLWREICENLQIFQAFLINGKIYMFPNQLKQNICVYSLRYSEAEYIPWEDLLGQVNVNADNRIYFMDYCENTLYGSIYDTNYLFTITVDPSIRCVMRQLRDDYKIANINAYYGGVYITLSCGEEKLICLHKNGEIDEIELLHEGKESEYASFFSTIIYDGKIFMIPCIRNYKIQVVDQVTRKKDMLEYPDGFCRRYAGRLFWQAILVKNKLYLTHCEGSGLVVLDMDTCMMEYLDYWKIGINQFLNKLEFSREDAVREKSYCGSRIYWNLQ